MEKRGWGKEFWGAWGQHAWLQIVGLLFTKGLWTAPYPSSAPAATEILSPDSSVLSPSWTLELPGSLNKYPCLVLRWTRSELQGWETTAVFVNPTGGSNVQLRMRVTVSQDFRSKWGQSLEGMYHITDPKKGKRERERERLDDSGHPPIIRTTSKWKNKTAAAAPAGVGCRWLWIDVLSLGVGQVLGQFQEYLPHSSQRSLPEMSIVFYVCHSVDKFEQRRLWLIISMPQFPLQKPRGQRNNRTDVETAAGKARPNPPP